MGCEFWLFAIGILDLFAISVVTPLIPLYLKQIGVSPSSSGFYLSLYGVVQVFSSPLIGHWSDSHGKIEVLFICLILTSAAFFVTPFIFDYFIFLVLVRVYLGIFKHTQDLCRNLIAEKAKNNTKVSTIGQYNAISTIGYIVGPIISGLLSQRFNLNFTVKVGYFICAFTCVINALIINFIFKKPHFSEISKKAYKKEINETNFDWKTHSGFFISRFLLALSVMLYRSSFVLGLLHFYPKFTAVEISFFSSYNAFINFFVGYCCSFIFSHKIYAEKEEKLQLHANFVTIFAFLVIACSRHIIFLMLGLAMLVIGTFASKASGIVMPIKRFGPSQAGKALGFNSSVISLARSLAPVIAGIVQEYSFAAPVLLSICFALISSVIFYATVYLNPTSEVHVKSE